MENGNAGAVVIAREVTRRYREGDTAGDLPGASQTEVLSTLTEIAAA